MVIPPSFDHGACNMDVSLRQLLIQLHTSSPKMEFQGLDDWLISWVVVLPWDWLESLAVIASNWSNDQQILRFGHDLSEAVKQSETGTILIHDIAGISACSGHVSLPSTLYNPVHRAIGFLHPSNERRWFTVWYTPILGNFKVSNIPLPCFHPGWYRWGAGAQAPQKMGRHSHMDRDVGVVSGWIRIVHQLTYSQMLSRFVSFKSCGERYIKGFIAILLVPWSLSIKLLFWELTPYTFTIISCNLTKIEKLEITTKFQYVLGLAFHFFRPCVRTA